MKKSVIIFFVASCLFVVSCKKKHKIINLPRIEYDVLLNNYGNNYSWFDHMDGFSRLEMFDVLISNARSGNFRIEDINGQQIMASDLDSLFELKLQDDSTETRIQLNAENLNGIRFRESWKINSGTGEIEKEVIAFCPVFFTKNPYENGTFTQSVSPLFWIYPLENSTDKKEKLIMNKIAFDVVIDNTLDMIIFSYGNQLPFYFCNIEQVLKNEIIDAILEAGFQKKTPVYDYFFNEMKDEEIQLLESRYNKQDFDASTEILYEKSQIQRLKFIEEWTIDKQSLKFSKNIIAVSPSVLTYDDYGELKGFRFLFWLLFDQDKKTEMVFE